ncbi:hypothetical protein FRC03_008908 [Tulasnella sp. 419]|nr:hypothetical protein FRC03_008908 [Tulasnella sp. 419]
MRNLSISSLISYCSDESKPWGDANITGTTVDVDNDVLYFCTETTVPEREGVEVNIWRTAAGGKFLESPTATLKSTLYQTFSSYASNQVVSFKCIPEKRIFCLILAGGDIATFSIEDGGVGHEFEVVGTVDSGIKCAQWSPDDEFLVLINGNDELLQMTREFDVVSESPIRRSDFGQDESVNVGWGSKSTQFHGSLGKQAAAASTEQASKAASGGSSPDDDTIPRISWRGDGAFFVVSSLDKHANPPPTSEPYTHRKRALRVYDRSAVLQATSEPVPGLEHAVSWRPSGSLIASSQRFGFAGGGQGKKGRHDVVFFERNGLRHGEFGLREELKEENADGEGRKWGYRVREMSWSSDSNVLAVWLERDSGDVVQLWTIGNYHWYLKQELPSPASTEGASGRYTSVMWHPEDALRLILTTNTQIDDIKIYWETCDSTINPPNDTATVAVVDGSSILMTPFRTQNVPPPMSSYKITRPAPHLSPPVHISFAPNSDALSILYSSSHIELYKLNSTLVTPANPPANPIRFWEGQVPDTIRARQILAWLDAAAPEEEWIIGVLGLPEDGGKHDIIVVMAVRDGAITDTYEVTLTDRGRGRMISLKGGKLGWVSGNGEIFQVDFENEMAFPIATFPESCTFIKSASFNETDHAFVGLSNSGKLYLASTTATQSRTLSTNCSSFTISAGSLIYTTTSHEARFAPLAELESLTQVGEEEKKLPEWEKRRVERGSVIVTAVPSAMSLVLQMPRGNLETINPRPLVLSVVRQDIESRNYRKAFLACRKHRIDLNILVDHDPEGFMASLSSFTEQVHEGDYINLFLTGVGQSSQSPERVAKICDAIREDLEKRDLKSYVNSILTAHVVKRPPDLEAALALLLKLRDTDPTLVDEAVKYVVFLVDADKLFDVALGMYDFSLVLLIAQHSQKDPREYLPFLRELRALESGYQRFRIDDHLKKYGKALIGLKDAGPEKFEEALAYIEKHGLHDEAIKIWKEDDEHLKMILNIYGDYLFERRAFSNAALVFLKAGKNQKAMIAYEKAYAWRELFALAICEGISADELQQMGDRVAEDLSSRKRYFESGTVYIDYAKDVSSSVAAFSQGNEFAEAERICALHSRLDLIEIILHPTAVEIRELIGDDLQEMKDQLEKQSARIVELRTKKETDPDSFFGNEDSGLHEVEMMTDAGTTVGTTFTRYTAAPSTASKKSRVSAKTKRKLSRNRGKKGTAEEEEYIMQSIVKLVGRLQGLQAEASKILPYLLKYSSDHENEGRELQKELIDFEEKLKSAINDVWAESTSDDKQDLPNEGLEESGLTGRKKYGTNLPPKPEAVFSNEWRVSLLRS